MRGAKKIGIHGTEYGDFLDWVSIHRTRAMTGVFGSIAYFRIGLLVFLHSIPSFARSCNPPWLERRQLS